MCVGVEGWGGGGVVPVAAAVVGPPLHIHPPSDPLCVGWGLGGGVSRANRMGTEMGGVRDSVSGVKHKRAGPARVQRWSSAADACQTADYRELLFIWPLSRELDFQRSVARR